MTQLTKNSFTKEAALFAVTVLISFLAGSVVCEFVFGNTATGLHLHDTYFFLSVQLLRLPFLLLAVFVVYAIRIVKNNYTHLFANLVMLISGVLLVLALGYLMVLFSGFISAGHTTYPPLSQLKEAKDLHEENGRWAAYISGTLFVVQVLVLSGLSMLLFKWGKAKRINY